MAGIERPTGEPQAVHTRLGEPFKVSPDLNTETDNLRDCIEVPYIPLKIEGLGTGRIKVQKSKYFLLNMSDYAWQHPESHSPNLCLTPAGDINTEIKANDDGVLIMDSSRLPLQIVVELDKLNKDQISSIKCELEYGGKKYEGIVHYDETELDEDEVALVDFYSWRHKNWEVGKRAEIFLPQDPQIFKDLSITLSL